MKIKKATASFGRLNGSKIDLCNGLNIVQAPNESGKSTWCAFLRTMLYGINTSERDKAGFISDKTRYQPWDGGSMEGSMEILYQGKEITIQRSPLGRAPMKNFTAVYSGTEIPVPGLNSENAGVSLVGVTSPVFERSAFIRQSGIKIAQNTELEKRINSIVSSGDETVSYTEVDARLRSWQRHLKYNNAGTIPTLQAKLSEAQESINALKKSTAECAKLRSDSATLSSHKDLLERELESFKFLEKIEEQESVSKALKDALDAENELKSAEDELAKFGKTEDSYLNAIRGDLSALESFKSMEASSKAALEEALRNKDEAGRRTESSVFSGLTAEKAAEQCLLSEKSGQSSEKKHRFAMTFTIVFLILVAVSAVAGFFISAPLRYALWALSAVLIASVVALNISAGQAASAYKSSLSAYGMSGEEEFKRSVKNYQEACNTLSDAESSLQSAKSSYEASSAALTERIESLIESARKVYPGVTTIDDILPCLEAIDNIKHRRSALESRAKIARGLYQSLEKGVDMTPVPAPACIPRYTKSRTLAMLHDVTRSLENASAAYNMTLGRMRALGDPLVLEGECLTISDELETQNARLEAITLAISALKEADSEIQTRFAPMLAKTAGSIFRRLTGGKYDLLAFDRSLDAAAQAHGGTVSHNILTLSEGTYNQVYLALRIAVCLLAMPQDDPCPIILDDALVSFDDERMGYALDYLKELSADRQIILFTCHSRESAYFHDDNNIRVIKAL